MSHEINSSPLRTVPESEWVGTSEDPYLNDVARHDSIIDLMGADVDSRVLYRADVRSARTRDLGDGPDAASETHSVK